MTTTTELAKLALAANDLNTSGFLRNRIINGDMRINQRGATVSTFKYVTDRWGYYCTVASKMTAGQGGPAAAPSGFPYNLYAQTTNAYAPAAADVFQLYQAVEGLNVADFAWGTANAKTITVSFWAFGTISGLYGAGICNADGTRSYTFTYTLAANTWTYVTATIPGDTQGTWKTDNTIGLTLRFSLGVGANAQAPAANAWQAGNYLSVAGAVSVVSTASATLNITGVQLEIGTQATAFERRPFGQELSLCQRYFYKTYDIATAPGGVDDSGCLSLVAFNTAAGGNLVNIPLPGMRTAGTVTVYASRTGASGQWSDSAAGGNVAMNVQNNGQKNIQLVNNQVLTAGHYVFGHVTVDAEL